MLTLNSQSECHAPQMENLGMAPEEYEIFRVYESTHRLGKAIRIC